jgi:hypothetical protein
MRRDWLEIMAIEGIGLFVPRSSPDFRHLMATCGVVSTALAGGDVREKITSPKKIIRR